MNDKHFNNDDLVIISPDADFSDPETKACFAAANFMGRVSGEYKPFMSYVQVIAATKSDHATFYQYDLVSPQFVEFAATQAAPVSTDAAKAKAYDALVAQLGGMTQEWQANYLRNVSDQTDNMYTHGYRFGKQDAAGQVRAVLMHAQLVADEPPVSDDPEVETKRFQTLEVEGE